MVPTIIDHSTGTIVSTLRRRAGASTIPQMMVMMGIDGDVSGKSKMPAYILPTLRPEPGKDLS
jgi:hypothetical protein